METFDKLKDWIVIAALTGLAGLVWATNNSVNDLRTEVAVLKDRSVNNPVSASDIALLKSRVDRLEDWAQNLSNRLADHQRLPHPIPPSAH